jgi:hypothetical protein
MTEPSPLARFLGDIARPWSLISVGTATAWSIFDGKDAAIITAAGLILSALYGSKALEEFGKNRNAAKVEEAKAKATGHVE